jgi:hypothetical protein
LTAAAAFPQPHLSFRRFLSYVEPACDEKMLPMLLMIVEVENVSLPKSSTTCYFLEKL